MAIPLQRSAAQQCVTLSTQDNQQLADFAASSSLAARAHADQELLTIVRRHLLAFPSIQAILHSLATDQAISHLVIDNLPIDAFLPAPPSNSVRPAGKSWLSETILLQLAMACGLEPFGYREEKGGALVHEISPASGRAEELSSSGSVALGWHTDLNVLRRDWRPEFLFLIGLRNQAGTPTFIAELEEVLATLRQRDVALVDVLREPHFRVESPASLHLWGGGKSLRSEPRPLIAADPSGFDTIAGNLQTVTATDAEARQALVALQAAVCEVARPIVIGPGEALLFNNGRCLHGRPAIQRGQRWLQRLYCRRSLQELREATGSTPEATIFSLAELILQ